MIVTIVNGQKRYCIELSPGFSIETSNLSLLLEYLLEVHNG